MSEFDLKQYHHTVDSITARILLQQAYEEDYNIAGDDAQDHPWDFTLMRAKEDYRSYGPLENTINRYVAIDVFSHTGLNLIDFLSLPRTEVESIFKICSQKNKRKAETTAAQLEAFKQGTGGFDMFDPWSGDK